MHKFIKEYIELGKIDSFYDILYYSPDQILPIQQITYEGGAGSGKSTCFVKYMAQHLDIGRTSFEKLASKNINDMCKKYSYPSTNRVMDQYMSIYTAHNFQFRTQPRSYGIDKNPTYFNDYVKKVSENPKLFAQ